MKTIRFVPLLGVLILSFGCLPGGVEVGPVQITTPVAQGTLATSIFTSKAVTIPAQQFACDFPTEEDINSIFKQEVQGIDLSEFIRVSGLELLAVEMESASGNFNFISGLKVTFVPAPVLGIPQPAVLIGEATNPAGFGSVIEIIPADAIDLLAIIRQNDSPQSGGCPKFEFEITFQSVPTQDIPYELFVTVDAKALLGQSV